MTETEKLNEMNFEIILSPSSSVSAITNDFSICNNIWSSNSRYSDYSDINLNVGIASSVTDTIVQHEDRLNTRERINNKKIIGNTFENAINIAKIILLGCVLFTKMICNFFQYLITEFIIY